MKTTKRILALLVCNLVLLGTAFAERVSEDDAALVANNFMNVSKVSTPKKPSRIRRVTPKTSTATQQQYYIFENADGEGWVMVAANDAAHPIIAYSDEGQFRFENQPENVKHWLGKYDKQIKYADDNNIQATDEVKQEWKQLREGIAPKNATAVVSPLIKTGWDQDSPYWNLCPQKGSSRCYTGCVATAMAQVMNYWQWPVTGTGSHSITFNNQTYTANFGETTYDWTNMKNTYSSSTAAQKTAVATLMYHCGVAVDMSYGTDGSAAYTIDFNGYFTKKGVMCAETALTKFFGYNSSTIKGYYRNGDSGTGMKSWTESAWIAMLKEELDASRPIMYAGGDSQGESGHSFVCDGYDSDNKFHFNWGWGNLCDGYYSVNSLVPTESGSGGGNGDYSYDQDVIVGIMPPELGHTIKLTGTGCSLSADKQRVENGNSVTVTITPTDATYDYTSTTVKLGGTTISSSNYTLSSDKKTLTINGSAITGDASNDLTITVVWTKNRYKYEMLGENCTMPDDGMVEKNASLNLTITPASGYTLADAECWDVEMGGNKLTYGTGFTYNSGTGAFSIASVTGDVAILAYGGHQVKWYANGNLHATNMSLNDKITLPDNPADCSGSGGKKFVGWCTSSSYSDATTAPTFAKTGDAYSVDKYYAVYANGGGSGSGSSSIEKASSIAIGDEVVLVYETGSMELTSFSTSSTIYGIGSSYSTTPSGSYSFTVKAGSSEGTFAFERDNKYWNWSSGNSLSTSTSVSASSSWTVSFSSGNAIIANAGTADRTIRWNTSSPRFACYTSGQADVQLYKKGGSSSYTDYSTTCTLCTLTGITLNTDGVTKTFTQGDAFSAEGLVVTASYSNCSSRTISPTSISTPDMSTIGEKTITVTYTENEVTQTATYKINVNAAPTHAIRFFNMGTQVGSTQNVVQGQAANKPADQTACAGYTFLGWWTAELAEDNTESKTWITDFTATKDQDYYAVYSKTETSGSGSGSSSIEKASSIAIGDEVVLVYETGSMELTSFSTSSTIYGIGSSYSTTPSGSYSFTVKAGSSEGTFAFERDNKYWNWSSGNSLSTSTSVSASSSWTVSFSSGNAIIANAGTAGRTIRWNTSSPRFACYTSGQADVQLYKKGGSSTTYYTTEPNCVACTNKVNITKGTAEFGSFSIDQEGENDNCKAGGLVVTVSGITPNEDYIFSEITQTGIESGVTIDQNAKTVTYAKDVTGSSTINVVFVHKPTYTIRFYNNGTLIGTAQTVTEGKSANKPANPSACDGYDFVGWWTAELGESNTDSKTWITDFTATKDQDYYAAYSHTETSGSGGSSTPGSKTFSFSSIASANSWENGVAYTTVEDSPVTINALGDGNNGKWYTSNNGSWRMYSGGTVQITVDGGSVTSVTSSPSCTFSIEEGVATFSPSARTDFTSITVNYTVGGGSGSSTTYYTTEPDCCTEVVAPTVNVSAKSTSATISWNNQVNATNGYSIVVKQGTIVVFEKNDIAAGATSYTVTGLLATTEYNYTVVAKGATCNASASGNFSTTDCEDVPHSIVATTTVSTARISWTAEAATATIRVYEDKTCNNELTEKAKVGVSSPATIEGLEEHTTYYLKIWANGNCVSAVDSFTTLTTSVEIAEWFTDSIRIVLTSDDSVKVIIEDKQEQTTVTENYADSLFISKYFEATSNTKLIAVFNGTNHTIHLDDYSIAMDQGSGFKQTRFDAMKYIEESSTKYFDSEQLTLESGKEIILISYQDASAADAAIIECAMNNANSGFDRYYRLTTPSLQFNGDDAIGLVNPEGQLIDLIGAGTLAGGVDNSAIEATSQSGSEGGSFHGFMDKPGGWYTEKGYHKEDGNTETNNYALSTNRCLLIRRNHVKSGLDAVERNKTDFLTLGDYTYETVNYEGEWKGIQIPGPGCSDGNCAGVTAACEGFDDVGSYDYNEYYAQFDSISADTIGGTPNEDGTYTVEIPGLDTLACSTLRISVYDRTGTVQKFTYDYKVPIMIHSGEIKTQNELFTDHDIATCKECDVVVMDNATLTKETGDRNEIRNLILYPGSSFNLPADAGDYTVQSLQFRVEGENAPITKLSGNLIAKDGLVTVTRRINNDDSYFFSLPYDCNISDIHWSTGEPMVLDQGVRIKEYDSESRAKEGSGNGKPSHWKMVTGDKLYAGKGYQISVNTKYYRELVFPMIVGGGETNLTEKEDDKTSNVVNIKKYEPTDPSATTKNNWNWNFIAQPYIGAMIPSEGDNIKAGWLKYTEPGNPGDAGTWEYEDGGNEYLTLWNPATSTYDQTIYNKSGLKLDPFVAFFVQGKAEGTFTFEKGNRILSAPARHLAAKAENEDLSIFVGVTLSGNGQSDETTVRIRPDFTNEYELGYDLEKFLVFYTARPQIYMKPTDSRLAFQAINDETATNSFLPVGVYCYEAGTYTFGLSKDYPTDEIEAVYLYDKTTDVTTNLLYDTYSITTTQQLYTNTRFSLNVIVNRKSTGETTGFDATNAPDGVTRKIINNGHVYIQRSGMIYDVMGKQILNSK